MLGGPADGEEKQEKERNEVRHGFHRAWTACVGSPGYSKAAWNEASKQLDAVLWPSVNPDPPPVDEIAESLQLFLGEVPVRLAAFGWVADEDGFVRDLPDNRQLRVRKVSGQVGEFRKWGIFVENAGDWGGAWMPKGHATPFEAIERADREHGRAS